MSAGETVRAALVAALLARTEFAGVDGLRRDTAANSLPQASVEISGTADWSTKDTTGREVRSLIAIRVSRGQAMRLPIMVAAAEAAGSAVGGAMDGWRVGSAVLTASRSGRQSDGSWRAVIEHRVRVMQNQENG